MARAKQTSKGPVRRLRSNLQRRAKFTNLSFDEDKIAGTQAQKTTSSNRKNNPSRAKSQDSGMDNAAQLQPQKNMSSTQRSNSSKGKEQFVDENITITHEPEFNTSMNPNVEVTGGSAITKKVYIRGQWTEADMKAAMRDVEENGMSTRKAASKWGIPATNVTDWLYGKRTTKRLGPPTVLTENEEQEIVTWCKDMAELGHGLEVIHLKAYVAHICQSRPNPFNDGLPGKSWWYGFRRRHPDLTIRTAEGLDRDRAVMLRPRIVAAFYDNLQKMYTTNQYGPNKIWNCDETGVQAGRNCGMRVIAKLGCRSVPHIMSKSREWITVLCCVNAAGQSIPGFYLFKAKRQLKNYIAGCEPGACMAAQPHAWMTKELFLNWLHHFARSVPGGVSPTNRHLLIFDGHGSHVAFGTIQEARNLGIDLVTLPAHTSHKLQPLDVSVFSPFKNYFKSMRSKWMAKNSGLEIRRTELATLSSQAFQLALTPKNIKAGFHRTGIWPLDRNVVSNDMRPSEAFHVEEDEVAAVENILRMAGIEDGDVERCLEEIRNNVSDNEDAQKTKEVHVETEFFGMPKDLNQPHTINEEDDHVSSTTHVSQTQEATDVDDILTLPTQLSPPQWVKEGAINLNMQIDFNNEEVSLSMPSPPPPLPSEVVHYYADNLEWEARDASQLDAPNLSTQHMDKGNFEVADFIATQDTEEVVCTQNDNQSVSKFLKLPIERVHNNPVRLSDGAIRIGRQSQILTSDEYLHLLQDQEARKREIEDLKAKRREQAEERKAHMLVEKEKKGQLKIERELKRQKKEEDKLQRKNEELKREQARLSKEHDKRMKEWQQAQKEPDRQNRRLSSPSNPLPDQHHILLDMYNTFMPAFSSIINNQSSCPSSPSNKETYSGKLEQALFGQIGQLSRTLTDVPGKPPTMLPHVLQSMNASTSESHEEEQSQAFPGFWSSG
ncbi:hypothetical protein KI387_042469 [Taxus chinensis]|uniref:HTH CENPB-type domain-containing protein n=2 Tax=Taxus chinensis TaxID=29808 RepID=A0AA38F7B0_TAXCH|nr:hypothetical protein KI387_042469 [Taxus chinensis]